MFDLDEEKRIGIREIRAHPWYNKPMPQKFVEALDKLTESQEHNNNKLEAGVYQVRAGSCHHAASSVPEGVLGSASQGASSWVALLSDGVLQLTIKVPVQEDGGARDGSHVKHAF
eukprot:scaffold40596_cov18-Tisochrysis_lutea.AAC.1